jgi:hypothetical protein
MTRKHGKITKSRRRRKQASKLMRLSKAAARVVQASRRAPTEEKKNEPRLAPNYECEIQQTKTERQRKNMGGERDSNPARIGTLPPDQPSSNRMLFRRHPQPYLIRANWKDYTIVNDSLVIAIIS